MANIKLFKVGLGGEGIAERIFSAIAKRVYEKPKGE